jgi:1-acyl-sn-glycerol-3-phosphate acyltransferase
VDWAAARTAIHVEGELPDKSCLLGPKHINWADPFVVGNTVLRLNPELRFVVVGKPILFHIPMNALPRLGVMKVIRAEDAKRRTQEQRISSLHDHARTLGSEILAENTIGMSFPEGTRKKSSIGSIRLGGFLACGYAAQQSGEDALFVPVGIAGHSFRNLRHKGIHESPTVAMVIAEPIEISGELIQPDNQFDRDLAQKYREHAKYAIRKATDTANEIVGLPPLTDEKK